MLNRILSIVGGIGTVLIFISVGVRFARPEWIQYAQYMAWAGLVCVLVYLAGQWREMAAFYSGRQARYGTLSVVSVLVVLGILIAVNYLATRQNKRWDLTANQVFSLSDQTVKVLQGLDAPIQFTVYDQETNFPRFRDRLEEYGYHSNRVAAEYVDVDRQPARAKQAGIQAYGTLLIDYKGRTERVTESTEQEITNALIKAVTGETRKAYFTQGHGEKDPTSAERTGYNAVSQSLTNDNYGVERLILAQTQEVPADATAVIVAGPRTDFFEPEIEALRRYVAKGGKVMFLLDPAEGPEPLPLTNLTAFVAEWGIGVGTDVVLDASNIGRMLGTDASVPVAATYPTHPITERFELLTAFPFARSISVVEGGKDGRTAQPIVETGPQSWAETNLKSIAGGERVEFNADQGDRQGPIVLAAAVSAPATDAPPPPAPAEGAKPGDTPSTPQSRIVVFGDSDFAANFGLGIQGNRDLFANSLNWLAQQENLISIRPREPEDRRLTLTADQSQRIMLLSLFIIPGLVLGGGVYTWWRRR